MAPTRRALIAATAIAGCATAAGGGRIAQDGAIEADLRTYVEFGAKHAGGPGDGACGAWLETCLGATGYAVSRQAIVAATIRESDPYILIGDARADVATHCLGSAGAYRPRRRPLTIWSAPHSIEPVQRGSIVLAHLPVQRWSSAQQPLIRDTIARAFESGAEALILVTHGPTRELTHLNRPLAPGGAGPIALMAPHDWPRLQAALAGSPAATLSLDASASQRPAFNVTAKLERGAPRWLVISTPRSGWGVCAGERGPGVAALLALARWAPQRFRQHNIALVVTSSHEFENAGGAAYLEAAAPAPGETALWLHLGAGFAARDWHEAGARLLPLPSADPQRFLVATADSVEAARVAFRGIAGLEAAYDASQGVAGELQNIVAAGYRAAGLFGAHRFHHVAQDDLRCVEASFTSAVVDRLARFLDARLS